MEPFYKWLYKQMLADDTIDEDEYDEEDFKDADDVLADDGINIDEDELRTQLHVYAMACAQQGVEPDYTGYEDLV